LQHRSYTDITNGADFARYGAAIASVLSTFWLSLFELLSVFEDIQDLNLQHVPGFDLRQRLKPNKPCSKSSSDLNFGCYSLK
jgi:hypothetical protein